MAEIQIVYREGYCDCPYLHGYDHYTDQCQTDCAEDKGCEGYDSGKHEGNVIPFRNCIHAMWRTKYKGASVKNYQIEKYEDDYNPHMNCMIVTIGNTNYACTKVKLDGECIYDGEAED